MQKRFAIGALEWEGERSAFSVQMTEEGRRRDSSLLAVAQNDRGSAQEDA